MAAIPPINNVDHSNSLKWYIGIFISVIVLFIVSAVININLLNRQFDKNGTPLSNSKQTTNPLTNLKTDSTKIYTLKEEDLQKFGSYIDYLGEKVESEVKRTQENNQYDIDRINTFLAIGIGLLAIFGGLIPIFVNYFSKEDLERRLDGLGKVCEGITDTAGEAKEQSEIASGEAKKAKESIDGFEGRVTILSGSLGDINNELPTLRSGIDELKKAIKKVPYIDVLSFQNAVAKLTSTDAMKLFVGQERMKWVEAYLENLILSLNNFDDDGVHSFEQYTDDNLKSFLGIISELKVALFLGPIRRIPDGRSFQPKIDETVLNLAKFEKMDKKNYKVQLRTIARNISELKQLVEVKV